MKCRILLVFMVFFVVRGMLVSPLSVLSAVSLVIMPQTAFSLVSAGVVISPVIWLGSVGRPGALFIRGTEVLVGGSLARPLRRLQPPCLLLLCPAVSTPPSSASVPASPEVPSSVPAVPASSAVTFDSEPVTSVAPSSVPVSRSSVLAHRDKTDSYLLSALGDSSRRVTDCFSCDREEWFVL